RRSQAICSQSTCFLARFLQAKPSLEVGCKDRAIQRMPRNSWPKEVSHDLGCCVFRQLEKTGAAVLRTLIETVLSRSGPCAPVGVPLHPEAGRPETNSISSRPARPARDGPAAREIVMRTLLAIAILAAIPSLALGAEKPSWAFPVSEKELPPDKYADKAPSAPGSAKTYTRAQIDDPYAPPDWYPDLHPAMPKVVA